MEVGDRSVYETQLRKLEKNDTGFYYKIQSYSEQKDLRTWNLKFETSRKNHQRQLPGPESHSDWLEKVCSLHWSEFSNIMWLEGASGEENWHLEGLSPPKWPFSSAHGYLRCHQVLCLVEGKVWMTSYGVPILCQFHAWDLHTWLHLHFMISSEVKMLNPHFQMRKLKPGVIQDHF